MNIQNEAAQRMLARFRHTAESHGSKRPERRTTGSIADAFTASEPLDGYLPRVDAEEHSVTAWNVAAYLGTKVQSSQADLVLYSELLGPKDANQRLRCTVTNQTGQPQSSVPVDLWQCLGDRLSLTEERTGHDGQVEFEVSEKDLKWLGLGAGTVDGQTSVQDFRIPVERSLFQRAGGRIPELLERELAGTRGHSHMLGRLLGDIFEVATLSLQSVQTEQVTRSGHVSGSVSHATKSVDNELHRFGLRSLYSTSVTVDTERKLAHLSMHFRIRADSDLAGPLTVHAYSTDTGASIGSGEVTYSGRVDISHLSQDSLDKLALILVQRSGSP